MAFVQAQQLGRKPKGPDVIDRINKGLGLAQNILGAVNTVNTMMNAPSSEEIKAARKQDAELKTAQIDAMKKKTLEPADQIAKKNYELSLKKFETEQAEKLDPKYKLSKLGGEAQNKVGSIAEGLASLSQMEVAADKGFGPRRINPDTAIIGGLVSDDPYSSAERTLNEVVGRLQSGGAIGDRELTTFKALGPRPGDDAQAKLGKLNAQKRFLENKLTAYGLAKEDLPAMGFKLNPAQEIANKNGGLMDLVNQGQQPKGQVAATMNIEHPDPAKNKRMQELLQKQKAGTIGR